MLCFACYQLFSVRTSPEPSPAFQQLWSENGLLNFVVTYVLCFINTRYNKITLFKMNYLVILLYIIIKYFLVLCFDKKSFRENLYVYFLIHTYYFPSIDTLCEYNNPVLNCFQSQNMTEFTENVIGFLRFLKKSLRFSVLKFEVQCARCLLVIHYRLI